MSSDPLMMWTIYERPSDHPDVYVARLWHVTAGTLEATTQILTHPSLEKLREIMRASDLTCIPRMEGDDPVIVEVWF